MTMICCVVRWARIRYPDNSNDLPNGGILHGPEQIPGQDPRNHVKRALTLGVSMLGLLRSARFREIVMRSVAVAGRQRSRTAASTIDSHASVRKRFRMKPRLAVP